ncbi:UNVERIFIED_CONTAM: hypothetical protein Sradi_0246900 [Sesamum radiatum]|uniref:Uncharacterized protein n=1 Tax=Sesamum radiatum TaxID=300843 RepID=A0AAW2W5G5_SESRA
MSTITSSRRPMRSSIARFGGGGGGGADIDAYVQLEKWASKLRPNTRSLFLPRLQSTTSAARSSPPMPPIRQGNVVTPAVGPHYTSSYHHKAHHPGYKLKQKVGPTA